MKDFPYNLKYMNIVKEVFVFLYTFCYSPVSCTSEIRLSLMSLVAH